MDDKAIRLEMLRTLINERFDGVAARLATALDMKPPQLHRWLSGRQGISADSARGIESRLGLTRGWLDRLADLPAEGKEPESTGNAEGAKQAPPDYLARKAPAAPRNPDVSRALLDLARELERGDLDPETQKRLAQELELKRQWVHDALARLRSKDQ